MGKIIIAVAAAACLALAAVIFTSPGAERCAQGKNGVHTDPAPKGTHITWDQSCASGMKWRR